MKTGSVEKSAFVFVGRGVYSLPDVDVDRFTKIFIH